MHAHRDRLPLVQLGLGAAFDFHAGLVRQAPPGLQRLGLEWAFRLAMEPRRLASRYGRHNPRFVWYFARQLLGAQRSGRDA
jgi:N-acetylglucosaminyldiphosphoundecaprenol N-acetyl-beta-D-mannosaminyltransferase